MCFREMAVTAIIIGAGQRGRGYAEFSKVEPEKFKVVGVAEPMEASRRVMISQYNLNSKMVWDTWESLLKHEKLADVAIITTQDRMHMEPAVQLSRKGYHILLEKPMSVTYEACLEIIEAIKESKVMFGVCHVLRYYPQYLRIRELIALGAIGEVCHIQHTEPVGFWHYAHSYVRGNWRKESESSSSLLAKCCHDLDLISYWMGENKCTKISSFGSLMHFTKDHKPEGATDYCLDCPVEKQCAYSAQKVYLDRAKQGNFRWPVSVAGNGSTDMEDLVDSLKTGPYGRCVYNCDNDVMSNQVVSMQFKNGATAALSMVSFSERICSRQTVISGTKGEITCEYYGPVVEYNFLTRQRKEHHVASATAGKLSGHGGADYFLMKTFIDAIRAQDQSLILAGPDETLYSHKLVFAAEKSRIENRVVDMESE